MESSPSTAKTVLVTGGSGFLGGWCIVELLNQGYVVRTTVRSLAREAKVRANLSSVVDVGDRLTFFEAELMSDDGWAEAAAGCDYVLHVASPFPPAQPKDADELVVPARDGTLRVIKAGLEAGAKRIVVTSSIAAVDGSAEVVKTRSLNESDWTDPNNPAITPYTKSKTVAELAAWELVDELDARDRLAVINPGAIIGPVLSDDLSYSIQLVERLLKGEPAVPKLGFSLVDVRDVAKLEIAAMTSRTAGGERFIAVREFTGMAEVAAVLRDRLGGAAKKVPTRTAPNFMIRTLAIFDSGLRSVAGSLGKKTTYSADKAIDRLDWKPRSIDDSVVDCAESLIKAGVV